MFHRQFDQAEFHINRSLHLNQSDGDNLIQLATCLAYLGQLAEAERLRAISTIWRSPRSLTNSPRPPPTVRVQ